MNVSELILQAENDGLVLSVTDAGKLRVRGDVAKREEWSVTLLANKADIVGALPLRGLPAGLELRLRTMARRWMYTPTDLATLLAHACADPAKWLAEVEMDEGKFGSGSEWLPPTVSSI